MPAPSRSLALGALVALALPPHPMAGPVAPEGARLLWSRPGIRIPRARHAFECNDFEVFRAVAAGPGLLAEVHPCNRMVVRDLRDGSVLVDRAVQGYNGHGDVSIRYAPELGGWLTVTLLRVQNDRSPRPEEFYLRFDLRDLRTLRPLRRWKAERAARQRPRAAEAPARLGPRDVFLSANWSHFVADWAPTIWRLGGAGDDGAELLWKGRSSDMVVRGSERSPAWFSTLPGGGRFAPRPQALHRPGQAPLAIEASADATWAAVAVPGHEAVALHSQDWIEVVSTRDGHRLARLPAAPAFETELVATPGAPLLLLGEVQDGHTVARNWRTGAVAARIPYLGRARYGRQALSGLAIPGSSPPRVVFHANTGEVSAWEIPGLPPEERRPPPAPTRVPPEVLPEVSPPAPTSVPPAPPEPEPEPQPEAPPPPPPTRVRIVETETAPPPRRAPAPAPIAPTPEAGWLR